MGWKGHSATDFHFRKFHVGFEDYQVLWSLILGSCQGMGGILLVKEHDHGEGAVRDDSVEDIGLCGSG